MIALAEAYREVYVIVFILVYRSRILSGIGAAYRPCVRVILRIRGAGYPLRQRLIVYRLLRQYGYLTVISELICAAAEQECLLRLRERALGSIAVSAYEFTVAYPRQNKLRGNVAVSYTHLQEIGIWSGLSGYYYNTLDRRLF